MNTVITETERELEGIAANIVHQIGDVLYENLPPDIAHEHFVPARQATNDIAIDFAKKLIQELITKARLDELERQLLELGLSAYSRKVLHDRIAELESSLKGVDHEQ